MPDMYETRSATYWPGAWSNGTYAGRASIVWRATWIEIGGDDPGGGAGWEADFDDFFIVPTISPEFSSPAEIVDGGMTNTVAAAGGTWPNVYTYTNSAGGPAWGDLDAGWSSGEDWGHWSDTNILRYFADDMRDCLASEWHGRFTLSFEETHEVSGTASLSSAVTNLIPATNATDGTVTTNVEIIRKYACNFTNYACTVSGDDCGVVREFPYTKDAARFASNISLAFGTNRVPEYVGRYRVWIDTNSSWTIDPVTAEEDWSGWSSGNAEHLGNGSWRLPLTTADFAATKRNGFNVSNYFRQHCTSVTNDAAGWPEAGDGEGDFPCRFSRTVTKTLPGFFCQRTGTVTLPDPF